MNHRQRIGLLLLLITALSAEEIDDLIARAPSHNQYPEAGAVVLLDRIKVEIDRNNNAVTERYLVVKLFEDRAKDDFGDIRRQYDKDGEKCEVLYACTHRPDGAVVRPEARAIADVSAPEVAEAPAYTNAMLKIVSFPALEPNAVIEYRIRVSPKKTRKAEAFSGSQLFGGFNPILKKEFILTVPNSETLKYGWLGDGPEPVIETLGNKVRYAWTVTDIAEMYNEPARPPLEKTAPRLWFSSYKDWQQVGRFLSKPFNKALVSTAETRRLAAELTEGKSTAEAVRSIYLYVTQKFRNIYLHYGDVGYEPHPAAKVIQQKYGDCRDKVCLLITLLRDAGITAHPVALKLDAVPAHRDVPSPSAFDWLICAVPLERETLYLDPFAEYWHYDNLDESMHGCDALRLAGAGFELFNLPVPPAAKNLGIVTAQTALDTAGTLSGTIAVRATGFYDNRLRAMWRDRTPVERKQAFDQLGASIRTGAVVERFWLSDLFDLTLPAEMGFAFSAPRYVSRQGNNMFLRVPNPNLALERISGVLQAAKRHSPLSTRPLRNYRYEFSIATPQGWRVAQLPKPLTRESDECSASITWTDTPDGLKLTAEFTVRTLDADPNGYRRMKAIADEFYKPALWEVQLVR